MADGHGTETTPGGSPPGALPATTAARLPLVGLSVLRTEDRRFLTGGGRHLDDLVFPGEARAFVLRSPHAHARILRIDTRDTAAAPGGVAVLTGAHVAADGVAPLPCWIRIPLKDGTTQAFPDRPILAADTVRFVGDPVAMVVAETLDQASAFLADRSVNKALNRRRAARYRETRGRCVRSRPR